MIVFMFAIMCMLAVDLGAMLYLGLCEQRRTQWQQQRVLDAIERFERRQYLLEPITPQGDVEWHAIIDPAWWQYEERYAA
jgi:hypothetical protein